MRLELKEAVVRTGDGVRILGPVSLRLGPGLTALTGPNGSGKSSLIKAAAGLRRLAQGELRCYEGGRELSPAALRLRLGYVPQELAVSASMTLRGYLSYLGELKTLSRNRLAGEILRVAGLLGLTPLLDTRIRNISEGQQRRLLIAQAMLGSPRLLLLDEPFAGIDMELRRRLLLHLQEYAAANEAAILVATHFVEEIEPGDYNRLLALEEGRIVRENIP